MLKIIFNNPKALSICLAECWLKCYFVCREAFISLTHFVPLFFLNPVSNDLQCAKLSKHACVRLCVFANCLAPNLFTFL